VLLVGIGGFLLSQRERVSRWRPDIEFPRGARWSLPA
jgi:hypothetical protein